MGQLMFQLLYGLNRSEQPSDIQIRHRMGNEKRDFESGMTVGAMRTGLSGLETTVIFLWFTLDCKERENIFSWWQFSGQKCLVDAKGWGEWTVCFKPKGRQQLTNI